MAFARAYGFDSLSVTTESGWAATTSASNTVAVSSAGAFTGGGGLVVTRGSAAGLVHFSIGTTSQPPTPTNAQNWYGLRIRFATLPSSSTVVVRIGSGSGTSAYILVDSAGALTCQIQGGTASATVATLSANVWYWLEILHDVSGTTHTVQARVNGGTSQSANRAGQAATTSRMNILGTDVAGGGTYTAHYDDLLIHTAQAAFLANKRKVLVLRPNGDWNNIWAITGGDGTAQSNSINEITPDDATSYIESTTANGAQLVAMSSYTLASGESFEGVSMFGRLGADGTTGTRTIAVNLRDGSAGTNGTASTWSASINGWQNSNTARDDPLAPTGAAWDQTLMDNMVVRILHSATADLSRMSTLWVYASVLIPTTITTAVGLVTSTATALSIVPLKTVTVGLNSTTNSALALLAVKTGALGLASTTNTALALTAAKTTTVGLNSTTNTALSVVPTKTKAAGLPSEADSALTLTAAKTKAIGLPSETETALTLTALKTLAVGLTAEADTAQGIGTSLAHATGLASEADSALALTAAKEHAAGLPAETDTALSIAPLKTVALGQASETDAAFLVFRPGLVVSIGQVTGTNTALAMTASKVKALGFSSEIDSALGLLPPALRQATETDTALSIQPYRARRRRHGRRSTSAALLSNPRRLP